ncbi:hypothetical protein NPIL_156921 [Nephila pilipes]|uniref:Protein kinase domain-containing protein n=1 Tax=Nephila pilipes TaxID=299642 RepID=A0A8X6NQ83_NEPPI|nr:hypothetical protein NPIL_156921 [Nephila pilipes]
MSKRCSSKNEKESLISDIEILPKPGASARFFSSLKVDNSVYLASLAFHGFHILKEELGVGNYGKVKRARQGGKDIAVKIINRDNMPVEMADKFLSREIQVLKEVQHKNIVKICRIFDYPRKVYIFMEYIERGNLFDYLKERTRLSEPESRYFYAQIISAVKYLHSLEIAHRDIKCENIMLTMNAEIKLIDFGFCKKTELTDSSSSTFCGSTAYAAPEVLQGIPYDPFMYDIWSLGCVLYVMVTGTMPFNEHNVMKMVEDQLNKVISYPVSLQLSESFVTLIDRMLEPDIFKRLTITEVQRSIWIQASKSSSPPNMSKAENQPPQDDNIVTSSSSDSLGMFFGIE